MAREGTLIFDWPGRHQLHLVLPVMLVLAAVFHLGVFFVFSIYYPVSEGERPDPIAAYLVVPGSEDADRLAALLPGDDPALFAPGRSDRTSGVAGVAYVPTYLSAGSALVPLPASNSELPSVVVQAGAVRLPVSSKPTARPPVATRLGASPNLAGRLPELPPVAEFVTSGRRPPETLRFLVSVGTDGKVGNVFLQDSSGDASLDASASALLSRILFAPAEGGVVWGDVSFVWGSDVRASGEP